MILPCDLGGIFEFHLSSQYKINWELGPMTLGDLFLFQNLFY